VSFLEFLLKELPGKSVPVATSGTTSGHAAGEPFSGLVFSLIQKRFPENTFKQHDYLNWLYKNNPRAESAEDRHNLIKNKPASFLLSRGKKPTAEWNLSNLYNEKQNDTSDTLFIRASEYHILDTKTTDLTKKSQPPNIISAYKVSQLCDLMISTSDFNSVVITYIGISWQRVSNKLVCRQCYLKELFRIPPNELYINWAAAMQIQFEVDSVSQSFEGNTRLWCRKYLEFFLKSAIARQKEFQKKFIQPFEKYL